MATLRGCCVLKDGEKLYGIEIDELSLGAICDCVEQNAENVDVMYCESSQAFINSLGLYALARGLKEILAMEPQPSNTETEVAK